MSSRILTDLNAAGLEKYEIPASPTPHLLATNSTPSASEAHDLRKFLSQIEPVASRLQQRVEEIRALLDKLVEKQQVVCCCVREHRDALGPRRRLPDELWSKIFLYTLPKRGFSDTHDIRIDDSFSDIHDTRIDDNFNVLRSPTLLGRVCSDWRAIAISMPELWTDISVAISQKRSETQAEWVRQWLERSGSCPLYLNVAKYKKRNSFERDRTNNDIDWVGHPTIKALVASSPRWREVRFMIPGKARANEVLKAINGNLASLRKLTISLPRSKEETLEVFNKAPLLQDVDIGHSGALRTLKLPFSQLTRFNSSVHSGCDILSILLDCPNLNELMCSTFPSSTTQRSSTVQHSQLRILHLRYSFRNRHYLQSLGPTLDQLMLPALRHFSLDFWMYWPQAPFLRFLRNSSCEISSLSLRQVRISVDELIACLREMPSLIKLDLLHLRSAQGAVSRLNDTPQLVPGLRDICVESEEISDGHELTKMIAARWDLSPKLSNHVQIVKSSYLQSASLRIVPKSSLSNEEWDKLQGELDSLKAAGFNVVWEFHVRTQDGVSVPYPAVWLFNLKDLEVDPNSLENVVDIEQTPSADALELEA